MKRDALHKAGGWAGVGLAVASLLNSYFDAQVARQNTVQVAAMARFDAVEEVEEDLEDLRERVRFLERNRMPHNHGSVNAARRMRAPTKKKAKPKRADVQQKYEDLLLK